MFKRVFSKTIAIISSLIMTLSFVTPFSFAVRAQDSLTVQAKLQIHLDFLDATAISEPYLTAVDEVITDIITPTPTLALTTLCLDEIYDFLANERRHANERIESFNIDLYNALDYIWIGATPNEATAYFQTLDELHSHQPQNLFNALSNGSNDVFDIMFMLDETTAVTAPMFNTMRTSSADVVYTLQNNNGIGIQTYTGFPVVHLLLGAANANRTGALTTLDNLVRTPPNANFTGLYDSIIPTISRLVSGSSADSERAIILVSHGMHSPTPAINTAWIANFANTHNFT